MAHTPERKRRPARGGVNPKLAGERTRTRYQTPATPASERAIGITAEPFGAGFDVRILPPLEDGRNFDQEQPTLKDARGYAGGLKMVLGLPVIDLSGGDA